MSPPPLFLKEILLWFIIFFMNSLMILMGVMFYTLLERKILSYSQNRIGPNKVVFLGLLQPLLDGVKLMLNEKTSSFKLNKYFYFLGPQILLVIMLFLWTALPPISFFFNLNYGILFLMSCLGFSIYSSLISGWASHSKFSSLGSIRGMAQTVSYELTLIFAVLGSFSFFTSLNFNMVIFSKAKSFFLFSPFFILWSINILAECGRAPFDFMEGESELVSGFNTEFSSSGFALLFVGEYGMIIFFSLISILIFLFHPLFFIPMFFFLSFFLIVRSSFPRFRYDFLMNLAWLKLLPASIFFLGFLIFLNS